MNRGDIWQLDLGGHAGRRPALVLTRQGVIPHLNKLTVAEITSHRKGYPTEVALGQLGNLPKPSFAQLDNIQTGVEIAVHQVPGSAGRGLEAVGGSETHSGAGAGRNLVLVLGEACL